MKKLEATQARQEFSETLNQVAYGKRRILVRRRGKDMAVIVPVDDLDLIERCEDGDRAPRDPQHGARARRTPRSAVKKSRRPRRAA